MKDVIGFGCLNVNLTFQIKNPEIVDSRIREFGIEGETYGGAEDFEHYLDFVSHMGRRVWQSGGGKEARVVWSMAHAKSASAGAGVRQ